MSNKLDDLVEEALQLPEDDRATLVARLMQSIPDSELFLATDDPDLQQKLDRRFADEAGEVRAKDLFAEP